MADSASLAALDLTPQRRSVFQNATIQEKRSVRLRFAALFEAHLYQGRFGDDDWIYARLLDLTGQKQCYRAVVVLIIGIMMDEFMQAWTDYKNGSPLDCRNQKQRHDLRGAEAPRCCRVPSHLVFGFRSMKRPQDFIANMLQ